MRSREWGASLLIPVLVLITGGAFGVIIAARGSGGDVQSTQAQAESLEALLLAESGLERAIKRFAAGTACNALGETISDLSALGVTGRTITIGNGLGTDFSSVALPSTTTQCRIPVTGKVNASKVTRTIHAIVDRNLLSGANNFTFDNPAAVGAPSGWVLSNSSYADDGGPDGTAPACSRSAWLVHTATGGKGGGVTNGSASATTNFTVTAGSTTTINFFYRHNDRGAGCGGALGGTVGDATVPCANPGKGDTGTICFRAVDSLATASVSSTNSSTNSTAVAVACADNGTTRTTYNPCSTGYTGYPTKSQRTMAMGGTGTRTITAFSYHLHLDGGNRLEFFLDYIEAINTTAVGAARVWKWRDCAVATCPAT
jgi:hypothetical protein